MNPFVGCSPENEQPSAVPILCLYGLCSKITVVD